MKRKAGLFKKAHELAVLCQVNLALIITTPENRTYEYTAGNLEDILTSRQELPLESKTPADFVVDDDDEESSDAERRNSGVSTSDNPSKSGIRKNYSIQSKANERPRLKVQIPHVEAAVTGSIPGQASSRSNIGNKDLKSEQVAPSHAAEISRSGAERATSDNDPRALATGVPQHQYHYGEAPVVSHASFQQFPNRSSISQLPPSQQQQQHHPAQQQQQQGPYFQGYTPIAPQGYFGAAFPVNYGLPSYPGQLPPPNGQAPPPNGQPLSNGSYNRWNGVAPQSAVGQYYTSVPEQGAKHEPGMASATAASMPSRYVNDTLMSPSNYFSMEWSVFDQQNSAGATGSAKAVSAGDAPSKAVPGGPADHDKTIKDDGVHHQSSRLFSTQTLPPPHAVIPEGANSQPAISNPIPGEASGLKRSSESFPAASTKWKKQDM